MCSPISRIKATRIDGRKSMWHLGADYSHPNGTVKINLFRLSNYNCKQFEHCTVPPPAGYCMVCLPVCLCLSLSKSPTVTLMMRFLPFLHADFVYRSKVGWLCYQGRVQGLTVFIYKGKRLSQSSTTQKKVTELTVYHVKYPCKELHVIFT